MSPELLYLIFTTSVDRLQYVKIDSNKSRHEKISFGVPQGYILDPILFNIYVSDMKNDFDSPCIQYADDTNLYEHCKVSEIPRSITTLANAAKSIHAWSRDNNLVFNPKKTKFILFITKQMSTKHKLNEMSKKVMINDNSTLDRVTNSRILRVNFDENLNWENHVTKVIKTCYSTLASLRKMKRLTDFKLRKQLSEQLVLSKLSYCDTVFDSLPAYQIKRLQKVMNCAAGFTLGRYATVIDVIKLNWLHVKEKIQFNTAKLVNKAL